MGMFGICRATRHDRTLPAHVERRLQTLARAHMCRSAGGFPDATPRERWLLRRKNLIQCY